MKENRGIVLAGKWHWALGFVALCLFAVPCPASEDPGLVAHYTEKQIGQRNITAERLVTPETPLYSPKSLKLFLRRACSSANRENGKRSLYMRGTYKE